MRIAMLGTRGVPARYGGFETAVEEVGRRLADRGHRVVVYCRTARGETDRPTHHLGMELVHLPAAHKRVPERIRTQGLAPPPRDDVEDDFDRNYSEDVVVLTGHSVYRGCEGLAHLAQIRREERDGTDG